ncbi:zinc-binding alcohol dehydrogenase family protein [Nocardiopsis sediminis]|uniref:Zinc-binding alcohol dehydrogenase family protein n=1 Tax=Nocardiopsis sediminis TaxID=1778267 RepID=A0ABV8FEI3_9ACTN
MRAVRFHRYGPPGVLSLDDVPDPRPGPGEMVVRVAASGIGFADVQMRAGLMRAMLPDLPLPYSPGFEVAGTVSAVGPGGDPAMVGEQVVGATPGGGGYAELAILPAASAVSVPKGLDDRTAVALLGQGATAVGVAEAAGLGPGDTVLVEAAAGGVGSLLVQLAKRAGARVVATARGEEKLAVARSLGADDVVDYSEPGWDRRVRDAAGGGVSVVFEGTGGSVSEAAFDLLAPGGRMVVYGTAGGQAPSFDPAAVYQRRLTVVGFVSAMLPPERLALLRDGAFALGADGGLKPIIGAVMPLGQAAAAHQPFEDRKTIGKTILVP